MSYGPGDISANDYALSGGSTFWTNLSTTVFSSGGLVRPTSIACRWGANSGSVTGHNDLWNGGGPREAYSSDFSVGVNTFGSYNNVGTALTWFLTNQNYFGGYWRTASQNSRTPFRDGSGGNYGGLSADDSTVAGYTANWAGVGSPGGLGWAATTVNCAVFVRRSGVWTQANIFVRRSGVWTQSIVYVRRSSVWTPANWLTKLERHIPEAGLACEVDAGQGWEPGYIVEDHVGWFGAIDPTALGLADWTKPGIYTDVPYPAPFTGRYNSEEPEEIVDARLHAYDRWLRALKFGNQAEADHWLRRFQPALLDTSRLAQAA